MNYKQTGFRPFYHHFCSFPLSERTVNCIEGFPRANEANAFLTYGYYDAQAGLTLEVVAAGRASDEGFEYFEPANEIRSMIRIESVAEEPFRFEPDKDGELAKRYADKVAIARAYDASEAVEETREFAFLDKCRHESCIDDVQVYFLKEGNQMEVCWVRITGLGEGEIFGMLLDEPYQDFGCHKSDEVAFFIHENEDKSIACLCDINPYRTLTEEDLEDGSLLEAAVKKLFKEKTEINYINVLQLLRDSYVWIPCTAVLSDADQARLEAMFCGKEENLDQMVGEEFVAHDETRLVPDVLQSGDNFFLPIFSTMEAMGEYGNDFSKVQKPLLDAITLARNNEIEIAGLALNPFSEPFVLAKEAWEIVEGMSTRIVAE